MNNDQMIAEWAEDGWYPLIVDLDRKLENVVPGYAIDQITEAFGSLRVVIEQGDCTESTWGFWYPIAEAALWEAEYLSESVAR